MSVCMVSDRTVGLVAGFAASQPDVLPPGWRCQSRAICEVFPGPETVPRSIAKERKSTSSPSAKGLLSVSKPMSVTGA